MKNECIGHDMGASGDYVQLQQEASILQGGLGGEMPLSAGEEAELSQEASIDYVRRDPKNHLAAFIAARQSDRPIAGTPYSRGTGAGWA